MRNAILTILALFIVSCDKIEFGSVTGTVTYTGDSKKANFLCYLYDAKIENDIISVVTQEQSAKMDYNFIYADNFDYTFRQLYSGYRRYSITATGTTFSFDNVEEGTYMLLIEHGTCYSFPNIIDSDSKTKGVVMDITSRQYKLVTISKSQPITAAFVFEDFISYTGPADPSEPMVPTE